MKKSILLIIIILLFLTLGIGLTYSFFNSSVNMNSVSQDVAKFIFNDSSLDNIEIVLNDLVPGDIKEYNFSVSNNRDNKKSNVSVDYQIIIHTYHFIPLVIELYSINDGKETLVMDCNEKDYKRNEDNELICDLDIKEMSHLDNINDEYKLKVIFPNQSNNSLYSSLVDYINIEIKSWQKVG